MLTFPDVRRLRQRRPSSGGGRESASPPPPDPDDALRERADDVFGTYILEFLKARMEFLPDSDQAAVKQMAKVAQDVDQAKKKVMDLTFQQSNHTQQIYETTLQERGIQARRLAQKQYLIDTQREQREHLNTQRSFAQLMDQLIEQNAQLKKENVILQAENAKMIRTQQNTLRMRQKFHQTLRYRQMRQMKCREDLGEGQHRHAQSSLLLKKLFVSHLERGQRERALAHQRLIARHEKELQAKESADMRDLQSLNIQYLILHFELESKLEEDLAETERSHDLQLRQMRREHRQEIEERMQRYAQAEADMRHRHSAEMQNSVEEVFTVQAGKDKANLNADYLQLHEAGLRQSFPPRSGIEELDFVNIISETQAIVELDNNDQGHEDLDADFSELEKRHEKELSALRKAYMDELKALRSTHAVDLADLTAHCKAELSTAQQNLRTMPVSELHNEKEYALREIRQTHATEKERILEQHRSELENQRQLHQKEVEVEQNSHYFRAVMTYMIDPMVILGRSGIITEWNQSAVEVFGYEEDDAVGKHFSFLNSRSPGDSELVSFESIAEYVAGGAEEFHQVVTIRHASGNDVKVRLILNEVPLSHKTIFIANFRAFTDEEFLLAQLTPCAEQLQAVKDKTLPQEEGSLDDVLANIIQCIRTLRSPGRSPRHPRRVLSPRGDAEAHSGSHRLSIAQSATLDLASLSMVPDAAGDDGRRNPILSLPRLLQRDRDPPTQVEQLQVPGRTQARAVPAAPLPTSPGSRGAMLRNIMLRRTLNKQPRAKGRRKREALPPSSRVTASHRRQDNGQQPSPE